MSVVNASAFQMIRELRDQLEFRISQTDDFRALMALNRELSAFERERVAAAPKPAQPLPAVVAAEAVGFPSDFDLDEWVAPAEPKRWWRKFG